MSYADFKAKATAYKEAERAATIAGYTAIVDQDTPGLVAAGKQGLAAVQAVNTVMVTQHDPCYADALAGLKSDVESDTTKFTSWSNGSTGSSLPPDLEATAAQTVIGLFQAGAPLATENLIDAAAAKCGS